jgi:hypothetical protein
MNFDGILADVDLLDAVSYIKVHTNIYFLNGNLPYWKNVECPYSVWGAYYALHRIGRIGFRGRYNGTQSGGGGVTALPHTGSPGAATRT